MFDWKSLFEKLAELTQLLLAFLTGKKVGEKNEQTKILKKTVDVKKRQEAAANRTPRNIAGVVDKLRKHKF